MSFILTAPFSVFAQNAQSGTATSQTGGQNVQSGGPTPSATLSNPLGTNYSIPELVGMIIKYILGLVGTLSLLMFIWAGFMWLTAQGNPDKVKKGRDTMLWAIVGLIIVFSSYAILSYVFKVITF